MLSIDPKSPIEAHDEKSALKQAFASSQAALVAEQLEIELDTRLAEIAMQLSRGEITPDAAAKARQIIAARRWRNSDAGRVVMCEKRRRYRAKYRDRENAKQKARSALARRRARGEPDDFVRWTHLRLEPTLDELKKSTLRQNAEIRAMLQQSKKRARKSGHEFSLKPADIVIPTHCPVFGTPLSREPGRCTPATPSIDRLDNARGYVPGNIHVISFRANTVKGSGTLDELRAVVKYMEDHLTPEPKEII